MRITRSDLLKWQNTASSVEERDLFLDCLEEWNRLFPGDLEVGVLYAAALINKGETDQGIEKLGEIIAIHPEYGDAYNLLYKHTSDEEKRDIYYEYLAFILGNVSQTVQNKFQWADQLTTFKEKLSKKQYPEAEEIILDLLHHNADNELIAIYHLKLLLAQQDDYTILQFSKNYHEKWANCLVFILIYAEYLFKFGAEIEALKYLRDAVYKDHLGLVAKSLWGTEHEYSHLWPDVKDFAIEKEEDTVINSLLLKKPEIIEKKKQIEKKSIQDANTGRKSLFTKPVYVILTSKAGVEKKYGENTYKVLLERLQELATAVALRENWSSIIILPDDENNMMQYGLSGVENNDPWQIKLAIHDLSTYLDEHDKRIGAILIIGGDEIIPFHRLPNPTDDLDSEVLSDNPYTTDDNNYYVPEWAVGRLPDEKGNDPGLLLKQIRQAIQWHKKQTKKTSFTERIGESLQFWNSLSNLYQDITEKKANYGYATAIWQRSSISAFRPIGKANYLRISPPYNSNNLDAISITEAEYAYFNLHGLDDSPNWYGQKDVSSDDTVDFPVALQPAQIDPQGENPQVVLSEACYGAYVIDKTTDEAISLRFLTSGCKAFIGSSCIAYGSIYPPLIGADQFAYLFWNLIEKNYTVGDAFVKAKINLTKSILRKQGYLDGEDQKTLLSFVLYGDPLFYSDSKVEEQQNQEEEKIIHNYQVVTDQDLESVAIPKISADILSNVKEVVKEYLPGIEGANLSVREKQMKITRMVKSTKGVESIQDQTAKRVFLTYKKSFQIHNKTIKQFTRVTLDDKGKMIKFSVSK